MLLKNNELRINLTWYEHIYIIELDPTSIIHLYTGILKMPKS